jgi:hypothetical protein
LPLSRTIRKAGILGCGGPGEGADGALWARLINEEKLEGAESGSKNSRTDWKKTSKSREAIMERITIVTSGRVAWKFR